MQQRPFWQPLYVSNYFIQYWFEAIYLTKLDIPDQEQSF